MFERLTQGLRGFVEKVARGELSEKELEATLWALQLQLTANDVAAEVAEAICADLKERLRGATAPRLGDRSTPVREALRASIAAVMSTRSGIDLLERAAERRAEKRPLVVMFVGINGTGKTTTIAKVAELLRSRGLSVVLASGDTHRAGAIEQLEEHARRIGVRVIKHGYGSDPAAVCFDAVQHAAARGVDAVLIDTAGRMQTNRNLMDELSKIKRVVRPDLTVMVADALIGNDAVQQAEAFNRQVGFDAAILTKVDADAKGGSSLSIAYATGRPIIYVGTGQGYGDLQRFDAAWFAEKILPPE